jgi:hypothetical protein
MSKFLYSILFFQTNPKGIPVPHNLLASIHENSHLVALKNFDESKKLVAGGGDMTVEYRRKLNTKIGVRQLITIFYSLSII